MAIHIKFCGPHDRAMSAITAHELGAAACKEGWTLEKLQDELVKAGYKMHGMTMGRATVGYESVGRK